MKKKINIIKKEPLLDLKLIINCFQKIKIIKRKRFKTKNKYDSNKEDINTIKNEIKIIKENILKKISSKKIKYSRTENYY